LQQAHKQLNLGITLAALAEESVTRAPVEAPSQPFPGWMTKPVLSESEDLGYPCRLQTL